MRQIERFVYRDWGGRTCEALIPALRYDGHTPRPEFSVPTIKNIMHIREPHAKLQRIISDHSFNFTALLFR